MQEPKTEFTNHLLKARRTAMLVIHGIGEQNPYETLDNFARHLTEFFKKECGFKPAIKPEKIEHDDWVEVCLHLTTPDRGPKRGTGEIDLYEYYWAPCTEGKITYREVLRWLAITTLTPIRYLAVNLEVESDDGRIGAVKVFFKELFRIFFLYLPLLVAMAWGAFWYHARGAKPLQELLQSLSNWVQHPHTALVLVMLGLYVTGLYLLIFAASCFAKMLAKRPSIQPHAERAWGILASVIGVALVAAAWVLGPAAGFGSGARRFELFATLIRHFLAVLPLLLAWAWFYFLEYYVGDVAVYVTSDQKAQNYAARVEILNGSTLALTRLLKAQSKGPDGKEEYKYDGVILVGHSLGSVIAYDSIDELLDASDASADELVPKQESVQITRKDLEKLTGLVTFGSPLDKIYYFFREHVASDQAIRAQILSYLHSFRKVRSHRDYGDYEFTYDAPQLPRLQWLNAWSIMDVVSGKLRFYTVTNRQHFWYWVPLAAHLSYWKDLRFYRFIAEHLLLVKDEGLPQPSEHREAAQPVSKAAASVDGG
jgi:hypothetical protein